MAAGLNAPWLHPLWRVRWLSWRHRSASIALARPGHRIALLAVGVVLVAYAFVARWAGLSGLTARVDASPLVPTVVVFALTYVTARAVVASSERDMRHGFTAALPVSDAARRRTSLVFALVAAFLLRVPIDVPFAFGRADVPGMFDAATLLGALFAWLTMRRWSAAQRRHENPALHQVPKLFFASRTPTSRAFPHLPLWQRLRATAHWRTAGRAWQLGGIALLMPRNSGIVILAMLVVLGTMLWWAVLVRAATSVVLDARALLAALHFDRARLVLDSLRYPAVGTAIATFIVVGVASLFQ